MSVACRGKQMTDLEAMSAMYSQVTNASGLRVSCEVDHRDYPTEAARRRAAAEAGTRPRDLPTPSSQPAGVM